MSAVASFAFASGDRAAATTLREQAFRIADRSGNPI